MKGVAIILELIICLLMFASIAVSTPPLIPPVQYEQFCENQKVAGAGVIDMSTSIIDRKLALKYDSAMGGDGAIELDQEQAYSQNSDKLKRDLASMQHGDDKSKPESVTLCGDNEICDETSLNLYESSKMTYAGETPLVGGKNLQSRYFDGGIDAGLQEMFAVNEMEKEQESFFTSTMPYNLGNTCPEQFIDELKYAGRDTKRVDELMGDNPTHLMGIDTKNTFNGTWGTDATWHKIFYKNIKAHEMFTGKFEAEKLLKVHEYPVPEKEKLRCNGIDC